MKSFSLKFRIEAPEVVAAGLTVDRDPDLIRARQVAEEATATRERTRKRYADATQGILDVKAAVAAGERPPAHLEAALRDREVLAFDLAATEKRALEASKAVTAAERDARARLIAEAERRRDELQKVADQIAPVLHLLRDCELALDRAANAARNGVRVRAVEWPQSLNDESNTVPAIVWPAPPSR